MNRITTAGFRLGKRRLATRPYTLRHYAHPSSPIRSQLVTRYATLEEVNGAYLRLMLNKPKGLTTVVFEIEYRTEIRRNDEVWSKLVWSHAGTVDNEGNLYVGQ